MGSAEHDAFSPGSPNERESNERLFSLVCIYYWIYIYIMAVENVPLDFLNRWKCVE